MAIIGRSGTGKTTLLRALIAPYPRALALDPKRRLYLAGWEPLEGMTAAVRGWPTGWPRVIGRPAMLEDPREWLMACCRRAYQVGSCAVAVDELAGLAGANDPPSWLDMLLQRGRDPGPQGPITTIVASQRPRKIPVTVISEAEHVFCFDLSVPADRAYMGDIFGAWWSPGQRHGALYWRPDMARPVELEPISVTGS